MFLKRAVRSCYLQRGYCRAEGSSLTFLSLDSSKRVAGLWRTRQQRGVKICSTWRCLWQR